MFFGPETIPMFPETREDEENIDSLDSTKHIVTFT